MTEKRLVININMNITEKLRHILFQVSNKSGLNIEPLRNSYLKLQPYNRVFSHSDADINIFQIDENIVTGVGTMYGVLKRGKFLQR